MPDSIYNRPADYDLEHDGDLEDVEFYAKLIAKLRPRRVLELGCGSGRVTIPLADIASRGGFELDVVGVDTSAEMLAEAERKRAVLPAAARDRLRFVEGDLLRHCEPGRYDLIVVPCATLSHVLELDDQIRAWSSARDNLAAGGRFAVHLAMPNLVTYAESLQVPPRMIVEMDIDNENQGAGRRLVRYKTTRYEAHRQRATINFFYDRFDNAPRAERFSSHFESHVYFPRELELLFRLTGYDVEATYGGFRFHPLRSGDRDLVMIGRRRDDAAGGQPHVG